MIGCIRYALEQSRITAENQHDAILTASIDEALSDLIAVGLQPVKVEAARKLIKELEDRIAELGRINEADSAEVQRLRKELTNALPCQVNKRMLALELELAEAKKTSGLISAELQRSTDDHAKYLAIHLEVVADRDLLLAEVADLKTKLTTRMTFGEACQEAARQYAAGYPPYNPTEPVAVWEGNYVVPSPHCTVVRYTEEDRSEWRYAPITPAMLAAPWTKVAQ